MLGRLVVPALVAFELAEDGGAFLLFDLLVLEDGIQGIVNAAKIFLVGLAIKFGLNLVKAFLGVPVDLEKDVVKLIYFDVLLVQAFIDLSVLLIKTLSDIRLKIADLFA